MPKIIDIKFLSGSLDELLKEKIDALTKEMSDLEEKSKRFPKNKTNFDAEIKRVNEQLTIFRNEVSLEKSIMNHIGLGWVMEGTVWLDIHGYRQTMVKWCYDSPEYIKKNSEGETLETY